MKYKLFDSKIQEPAIKSSYLPMEHDRYSVIYLKERTSTDNILRPNYCHSAQKWATEDFPVPVLLSIMSHPDQNPQMMASSHIQTPKTDIFKALYNRISFHTNHCPGLSTSPKAMTSPPEYVTPRVLFSPRHSNQLSSPDSSPSAHPQNQLQALLLLTGSMTPRDRLIQRSQAFTPSIQTGNPNYLSPT